MYLNPSNSNIICKEGKISCQEKDKTHPLNLPIDIFFHSLGNDLEHRAIGVILSGTGTDGSRGIATIKEAGGTIIVQDPGSAQLMACLLRQLIPTWPIIYYHPAK
ncbi:MAG: hypothetical protein HC905_05670 [Bacteroidales bacterium]|nr:hypothetical protein [Bacteroidales bacterium]